MRILYFASVCIFFPNVTNSTTLFNTYLIFSFEFLIWVIIIFFKLFIQFSFFFSSIFAFKRVVYIALCANCLYYHFLYTLVFWNIIYYIYSLFLYYIAKLNNFPFAFLFIEYYYFLYTWFANLVLVVCRPLSSYYISLFKNGNKIYITLHALHTKQSYMFLFNVYSFFLLLSSCYTI
jgi:hypothetical protein